LPEQTEALTELASDRARLDGRLAEIERERQSAHKAARDAEGREVERAQSAVALVEAALAASRAALEPTGLENAVPRRVRPDAHHDDPGAVMRRAGTALDNAQRDLTGAVTMLLAHRQDEKNRRRQEFVAEEERRAEAERQRIAAEIRRKEEAEREAERELRRRQRITRTVLAGLAALVILIVVVLTAIHY
jgi:hypothetical protein